METGHFIAIFGGAIAGSEAAGELSKRGIHSVVFEQNPLPYGKLETGLPKWHYKLRDMQEKKIDEKLDSDLVKFVPNTKLGRDIAFSDLISDFGFTAILLATGAWRDRPLPIPGIDEYVGKGLLYMNPLVNWFNHNHDPAYREDKLKISDDSIIIGGGLASIDIAKMMIIETTLAALRERGIVENALRLEHEGVHQVLENYNLTYADLELKGCRLFTRHYLEGMPLTNIPEDASMEIIEKNKAIRKKILAKVQDKFPFEIIPNRAPVDKIIENGRLVGLIFEKTENRDGRFINVPDSSEEVRAAQIVSAIGSVPEPIEGLPLKGEIYPVENPSTGKISGFENVFALGNAVTGRGNIRQSLIHSRQVSENIVDQFLVWREDDYKEIFDAAEDRAIARIDNIMDVLTAQSMLSAEKIEALYRRIASLQEKSGYNDDYRSWISSHLPLRLELMEIKDNPPAL